VVGMLFIGGVYFAYLYFLDRKVLETEPGDIKVFEH
jgi:hypothetical protein